MGAFWGKWVQIYMPRGFSGIEKGGRIVYTHLSVLFESVMQTHFLVN